MPINPETTKRGNLLAGIPENLPEEIFETLIDQPDIRIERILSKNHSSPDSGWYDQPEDEWVMLLQGSARLELDRSDKPIVELVAGDYLLLPAHCRHKVLWTSSEPACVWLAIFFRSASSPE
ncbi:Uncharacterised protein [BD1-7 clade bacterium]|uniref:Cupin type-2 domain-containing protein n=1 Tax=BD1-7 clade bacterium TaxID=2029982 RepID=A0A5S9NWB0_9GAMM|nr:Uncharacterised protein [BD1-7 clade bacterium]CAA0095610.1 Uncharacterised protein [BD1-7 clade bacterium]